MSGHNKVSETMNSPFITFKDWQRMQRERILEDTMAMRSLPESTRQEASNEVNSTISKVYSEDINLEDCNGITSNNFVSRHKYMSMRNPPNILRPDNDDFYEISDNDNFLMPLHGIPQSPDNLKKNFHVFTPTMSVKHYNKMENTPVATKSKSDCGPIDSEKTSANVTQEDPKLNSMSQLYLIPPKPPITTLLTNEYREERRRLWREYRQRMKPFRNRDFYNSKRVVQRLGKKSFEELEEKERERLKRAKEQVAAYKARLNEKAAKRWNKNGISTESNTTMDFRTPESLEKL